MKSYAKTQNILFAAWTLTCIALLGGCTNEEKATSVAPVPPPATNAPASAAGAPSAEVLEREKNSASLAEQSSKDGERQFKEYLKNKK